MTRIESLRRAQLGRALWPPAVGWLPLGAAALAAITSRYGAEGTIPTIMMVIALPCAWVASVFCVVNVVRLARRRGMDGRLRLSLVLLNLSLPVTCVAGAVLS